MSSSSIYAKIEEKARAEALEIQNQGVKKAENARALILQEANEYVEKIINDNENKNADILKTRVTEIEQAVKQKSLACKKEIIAGVFEIVHQKLLALNEQDFVKLVIKLIKSADIEGNEVIMVSSKEHAKYTKLFSDGTVNGDTMDLNKLNKMLNNNSNLRLSKQDASIDGGFIIVGQNYDVDNSYRTILDEISSKMETETAMLLFEKQAE